MKAAPQAQARLLDLAGVDTAIAQASHRRKSLPEHARIAAGQSERAALGAQLTAAKTRAYDLEQEASRAESDLEPVRARLARDKKRVDGGEIADPKALGAMLEEIEHLTKRVSDLEDAQLEILDRLDATQAEAKDLAARRASGEDALRALIATRDAAVAEIDAEIAAHRERRAAFAAEAGADLLAAYEKTSERLGAPGAALLDNGRCTGCQLTLTASDLNRFRAAAPDEVLRCEECNRILVRAS